VRILTVRGVPALNYVRDPAGKVAVSIDDPRRGRFLGRDEQPSPLEHRYSVHECDGQRRAAQRGNWAAATSKHDKQKRNRRNWRQPAATPERAGQLRLVQPPEEHE
jgi:hypothetical protein